MRGIIGLLLLVVVLSACEDREYGSTEMRGGLPVPEGVTREQDPAVLAQGERLYRQHCARCHGADASGDDNWRKRDAEGLFPPPPLNGNGHAWHHSREVLANVIRNGSPDGKGNMPAWGERLSAQEIEAVISWFQSLWPAPVYDAWFEMQQRGR